MRQATIAALAIATLMAIAYFFFPAAKPDGKCIAWFSEKDGSKTCVMREAQRLKT